MPESLRTVLTILYGGEVILDKDFSSDKDQEKDKDETNIVKNESLSVAQDIVYGVSGGKKWTPKH